MGRSVIFSQKIEIIFSDLDLFTDLDHFNDLDL